MTLFQLLCDCIKFNIYLPFAHFASYVFIETVRKIKWKVCRWALLSLILTWTQLHPSKIRFRMAIRQQRLSMSRVDKALANQKQLEEDAMLLKMYVNQSVFPKIIIIPVKNRKDMLSTNEPLLCGKFSSDKAYRNYNNLIMNEATDEEWIFYLKELWKANHRLIQNTMLINRTTLYNGVKAGFYGN